MQQSRLRIGLPGKGYWAALVTAVPAIMLLAGDGQAQVTIKSKAVEVGINGRLHAQWNTTSASDDIFVSNQFIIRRARITVELKISDFIRAKIQPDYGQELFTLKDAYMDLVFSEAFIFRMGQFKRPFDLFELESSTRNLIIERDGRIRGATLTSIACKGVGNICSYSRFTERLRFSDRDIGVEVGGTPGKWIWSFSATNGRGASRFDENDAKSFSGRLELHPLSNLRLAGNVATHDFVNDTTSEQNDYAWGYGGDLFWGSYAGGLTIQAAVVGGDNWLNLDAQGDASAFLTGQAIVGYRFPVRAEHINSVQPVARISYGDPDTGSSDDDGLLFTPGLILNFSGRNRFAINADIYSPGEGSTEWSFKSQMYLHF